MSTIEDFENAPVGATATHGRGRRVMKMDNAIRSWITPSGLHVSDDHVWGYGFTLDPLPEPLYPEETK